MAKQPVNQDDLREMVFPYGGLQLTHPAEMSRPDTTEVAENVRFFETFTERGRGGSRAGLSKSLNEQVSGENAIQHMGAIVTVNGEMIDWSFDGPEQRFPGIYAGIGFIDFVPFPLSFPEITDDGNPLSETFDNEATSGYPPRKAKNEKIVTTITPSQYSADIGVNVILTVLLRNRSGGLLSADTLNGKNIVLHTDPGGLDGDGDFGSAGGSQLTPAVLHLRAGVVYYWATVVSVTGVVVSTSKRTKVRWNKITPALEWATPSAITAGTPLSSAQLNATAGIPAVGPVAGTFTYTPPSGTILAEGNDQVLSVHFEPTDSVSFSTPDDVTVLIDVTAGEEVDWEEAEGTGVCTAGDPGGAEKPAWLLAGRPASFTDVVISFDGGAPEAYDDLTDILANIAAADIQNGNGPTGVSITWLPLEQRWEYQWVE